MNRTLATTILLIASTIGFAQDSKNAITAMRWGADYNIHITFSNDSTTIYDVRGLYHSTSTEADESSNAEQVTYYPVQLDPEFISALKDRNINSFEGDTTTSLNNDPNYRAKTLWAALHDQLGGGYIHFINCLIYSLESRNLNLYSPFFKRPQTNWKPRPMTQSYKRTRNWEYYVPNDQKMAQKEYLTKLKNKELGDMALLPASFTELFLSTTQKQYDELVAANNIGKLAIIDMMRLLVASNYLGADQIALIQGSVSKSIMRYTMNSLPSVIIFDDLDAALAMTLDHDGYKIDQVTFNNESALSDDEKENRIQLMQNIIKEVNEVNKRIFERNLKQYYR